MEVKKGTKILISTKISAKGQITLPQKIRKILAVEPGDRLLLVVEGESVSLRALQSCSASALAGSLGHYARKSKDSKVVRAQVKKGVADAGVRES